MLSSTDITDANEFVKRTATTWTVIPPFLGPAPEHPIPWKHISLDVKGVFLREKECLINLNNNFECICKEPRTHFPKIAECDDDNFEFRFTHCGDSVAFLCAGDKHIEARVGDLSTVPFLEDVRLFMRHHQPREQINCIIHNLKINKIVHLDVSINNLCISKNGNLSLIDFGHATIGCWDTSALNPPFRPNMLTFGFVFPYSGVEVHGSNHQMWPQEKMIRELEFIGENLSIVSQANRSELMNRWERETRNNVAKNVGKKANFETSTTL